MRTLEKPEKMAGIVKLIERAAGARARRGLFSWGMAPHSNLCIVVQAATPEFARLIARYSRIRRLMQMAPGSQYPHGIFPNYKNDPSLLSFIDNVRDVCGHGFDILLTNQTATGQSFTNLVARSFLAPWRFPGGTVIVHGA